MSEGTEGQDTGAEAAAGSANPAAMALALGGASREEADAFLKDQRVLLRKQGALADTQNRHLHLQLKQLYLGIWEKRLGVLLRVATGFVGIAVAAGLAFMIWDASQSSGLLIEPFSVPPDFAQRGLTGQVVATQMLDNLSALQAQTSDSSRAKNSYSNNWGDDIKVEIPQTGVSVGELSRYLHQLLGHQTHITGEIVRAGSVIAITARTGSDAGNRFSGADADFDRLLQQASEAIYARTQPYRYGVFLLNQGKYAQAASFFADTARAGSPTEQSWAHAGMVNTLLTRHAMRGAAEAAAASIASNPNFAWGWSKIGGVSDALGHAEAALAANRRILQLLDRHLAADLEPAAVQALQQRTAGAIDQSLGDYDDEIRQYMVQQRSLGFTPDTIGQPELLLSSPGANLMTAIDSITGLAKIQIQNHDLVAARRILGAAPGFIAAIRENVIMLHDVRGPTMADLAEQEFHGVELSLASASEDWPQVRRIGDALDAEDARLDASFANSPTLYPPTKFWPLVGYAEAMAGDFAAAHAEIDRTPGDCDLCLRMRGRIDAAQKNYAGAAFWFADAVRKAPSIPFAYADWGQALMERGDLHGAIVEFAFANRKGPHFADPLEMWGEALMLQKHPDLALAKFAEAEKYAPNWGRLHLKWGEALASVGRKDEAHAQFARAARLDLTAADKAELVRVSAHS